MMEGIGADPISNEAMETPQNHSIPISKFDELPLIYQLLESYIAYPELALSIKEILFLPMANSVSRFHAPAMDIDKEFVADEAVRDVSHEQIMYRGVKLLNLSAEHEEKWVRTLTWMKPEVVDRRRSREKDAGMGSYFTYFIRHQSQDFMYHATAMLLTICPNTERLVYRDNIAINPVEEVLKRINYDLLPNKHLRNLKEVILVGTDDGLMGDGDLYINTDILNLLSMFHRLPSMEGVSAEAMESPHHSFEDTFPPGTSNIKRINIFDSAFGSDVIAALIRAPKALEDLTITSGGRDTWDSGRALMYAKEVGKALQCQKNSLQKLNFDPGHSSDAASYEYPEDIWPVNENAPPIVSWEEYHRSEHRKALLSQQSMIDEAEAQGPLRAMRLPEDRLYGANGETIGSLHDFERLTHLSINLEHLRGGLSLIPTSKLVDILPPNLEYLHVRGYTKGQQPAVDHEFAELWEMRSTKFPKLQQIYGIGDPAAEASHDHQDSELQAETGEVHKQAEV